MVKRKLREPLEERKGNLYFDGFSVKELADKYDTPLYLMSEKRIRDNYDRLYGALVNNYKYVRIYYAAKANTNLNVLKILHSQGAYLDTVSPGEVFLALSAGYTPDRIMFTGTSVRNDELKMLADANITINIDSQSEMDRLLKISVPQILSVRVNPEVGAGHHDHCITAGPESKFGLWEEEVIQAYAIAQRARVGRFGIHMHIGSGVLEPEPYIAAVEKLLSIAKRVKKEVGINFEFIDIGGGLGVPYKPEDTELDVAAFSNKVVTCSRIRLRTTDWANHICSWSQADT
jgi:diaminopimelate decarboxylase